MFFLSHPTPSPIFTAHSSKNPKFPTFSPSSIPDTRHPIPVFHETPRANKWRPKFSQKPRPTPPQQRRRGVHAAPTIEGPTHMSIASMVSMSSIVHFVPAIPFVFFVLSVLLVLLVLFPQSPQSPQSSHLFRFPFRISRFPLTHERIP